MCVYLCMYVCMYMCMYVCMHACIYIHFSWHEPPMELKPDTEAIIFVPTLLHPLSRGEVKLRSADPLAPPKIYPNYLDDDRDLERLKRACKR